MALSSKQSGEHGSNTEINIDEDDCFLDSEDIEEKNETTSTCFQLTKEGSSPVKWSIILVIFVALFGSAFVITFLFPFLPSMVVTLGYSEEEKGYYAGLVASSFFFGRVFGSYFWGWLSDRKGRKPVILINLALTCVSTFGFGFTRTLWFAIMMRFITGAMNGVISTAKSVLYEISDDSTQAITMSSISFAWGLGIIMGPTVGGFLANPSERYPNVFPQEGFFKDYPFFLPCMVSCFILLLAFVVVLLKLPETHAKLLREKKEKAEKDQEVADRGEAIKKLLVAEKTQENNPKKYFKEQLKSVISLPGEFKWTFHLGNFDSYGNFTDKVKRQRTYSCSAKMESGSNTQTGALKKGKCPEEDRERTLIRSHSVPAFRVDSAVTEEEESKGEGKGGALSNDGSKLTTENSGSLLQLLRMPDVQMSVGIYTLLSFAVVGYDQIFAIWSSTDQVFDGLGFTPVQIGLAIGSVSVPLMMLQLCIFPKLEAKLGAKRTNHWCCFSLMILITATPVLSALADKPVPLWIVLILILAPNRIATICCFTSMALFINNSVPPEHAGAVNGLSVTFAAIARAIAPLACGSIYAWSIVHDYGYPINVNLIFIIFGLVYMAAVVLNMFIPERLNKQRKKRKRNEIKEEKNQKQDGKQTSSRDIDPRLDTRRTQDGLHEIEIVLEEGSEEEIRERLL